MRDAYHNYSTKDIIQVWKTDANILYIVGDDDETLDPKLAEALLNQYPEDKRSLIEITTYPGAGHLIDPPYMPLCRSSYTPLLGLTQLWGGKVLEHARAQEHAWNKVLKFFKKHLDSTEIKIKTAKSQL